MKQAVRKGLKWGIIVTLAALFALFGSSGVRARVLDAYIVTISGVFMLMLVRATRTFLASRRSVPAFDQALAAMRAPVANTGELALERDLDLGRINAFHFHVRVRGVLREIAAFRLRHRYGVELDREPERARELLPTAAWEIVRPDRPPPRDRLGPGPPLSTVETVVSELERV